MNRRARCVLRCLLALSTLTAATAAAAQTESAAPESRPESGTSNFWAAVGASQVTARGDCQFCSNFGIEDHRDYTWGLVGDVGARVTPKTDVGGEVAWMPVTARGGQEVRATFLLGVAQYRPWESQGFFVKLGMGMAFTRNFVFEEEDPITQKALAVLIGGGWAFRRDERIGFQLHGTLHSATLGDFVRSEEEVLESVISNFWSIGAALVFR